MPYLPLNLGQILLLSCLTATLFMTGVIWIVQVVHYALFERVGLEGWVAYHRAHSRRITWVVLGPMIVELGTSGLLALRPTPNIPHWLLWLGLALAAATWAATVFISVPLHRRLSQRFDAAACRALVRTNWVRTALWTAHAIVLLSALAGVLARGRVS